jgi:hypothetical protein
LYTPQVPFAALAAGHAEIETFDLPPSIWRDASAARATPLAESLRRFDPIHVVVDLFWVPWTRLGLDIPATLLLRSVPPAWLIGPRELPFDPSRFERIWAIEDAPALENYPRCGAVVWRPTALPTRADLCARLGASPDAPLRLVVRSGVPDDRARLAEAADRIGGDWHELALGESGWPGVAPWLATLHGADHVVSAAGYNAFWEAQAYGYAARVTWVPCPRRLDDQAWRARQGAAIEGYDGAQRIAEALCGEHLQQRVSEPAST